MSEKSKYEKWSTIHDAFTTWAIAVVALFFGMYAEKNLYFTYFDYKVVGFILVGVSLAITGIAWWYKDA